MSDTGIKPRWKAWENTCIEKAFQQKIQLKIIALAMERTVSSVNKKIASLGLRKGGSKPGRLKGSGSDLSLLEKQEKDREQMSQIIEDFAPLQYIQKRTMRLKEGCWSISRPEFDSGENKKKSSFSANPLSHFRLLEDELPNIWEGVHDIREPIYVPLKYVEEWAVKEGFYRVGRVLGQKGLSFWKNGQYFSNAQLLIYLNHRRFEKNLHPITFNDERG